MTNEERMDLLNKKSSNLNVIETKEWWFDRNHQNQYVFKLAGEMLVHSESDPQVCVNKAKELVDIFYKTVLEPTTRKWR